MHIKQDLRQLLEANQIDPTHFDLEGFAQDQRNFLQALQKVRARHPDLAMEPVWSVNQVRRKEKAR